MSKTAMRMAVTGVKGQVVCALRERGPAHSVAIIPVGRPTLDLVQPSSVLPALAATRPDLIVNAAAYTAVDRAESEPEMAAAVNGAGAGAVAAAAHALAVPLIHLSTDYVFDGSAPRPYRESDEPHPLGVYGASKLAGERAVEEATPDFVILRTAWVYSPFGSNFAKTMLRLAATRPEISIVADQRGAPTNALDIAEGIIALAKNLLASPADRALRGRFHMTAGGEASWADFAEAILAASARRGGPSAKVLRITTAQYPSPARRPRNSRLDCSKLALHHGLALPFWRASVEPCVERLLNEGGIG